MLGALPLAVSLAILAAATVLFTDVRWERLVPVCVIVAGAALLAGAWVGRARPFVHAGRGGRGAARQLGGDWRAPGRRDWRRPGRTGASGWRNAGGSARAVGDVAVDLRRTESPGPIVLRTSVGKGDLRVARAEAMLG